MHFAVCTANFGSWADPRLAMRAAAAAQKAGWEGYFVWDHLSFVWGPPGGDAWVLLAAAASATDGLTLGTAITPIPRRRPQVLAQTVSTLAALNGGSVVLGAGLGGNRREFEAFGESYERKRRLELFDEGLDLISGLWSEWGAPHPIWVGGERSDLLERAAQRQGWIANSARPETMVLAPDDIRATLGSIDNDEDFDVAINGYSAAEDRELVRAYEQAGGTWWFETLHDMRATPDELIARIEQGPPR